MCDENRALLAKHGIYYPQGRWHGQLGSYFAQKKLEYVFNRHAGKINMAAIEVSDLAYITSLKQELAAALCPNVLFSYEGFIDLHAADLAKLRDFLLGYADEIQIIGYCRHPLSFAPSEISQRYRMGVPVGRGDTKNPPIPKFRDYFGKFETAFGRERIALTDFASEALYSGDVRRDLLSKLGLSDQQQGEFRLNDSRINESLSAEAILIADAMTKRMPPSAHANLFFMKFNSLLDSIKGPLLVLSD
jgi:hypothetical protein